MRSLCAIGVLVEASAVALCGCGGLAVVDAIADGCPLPASLSSQECWDSPEIFALEGVGSDGVRYRQECDGTTCTWYEDGQAICDCDRLDYVNTSAFGIPMCADWRPPWDFSTFYCEDLP